MNRVVSAIVMATALFVAGCASTTASDTETGSSETEENTGDTAETNGVAAAEQPTTTIENYPDAQTRALAARAWERRPVDDSALPPRHLVADLHPESLVDRNRIVSGGPPPDGIPSIDNPAFSSVRVIDWLADEEPVAVLTINGQTKIYPVQVLIWHEIVNDQMGPTPVAMTYCPLCNSVVAFDTTTTGPDGETLRLDFGTSGALYQSALVMYDRQTESLWTHFDGQSVIGTMIGTQLEILPAAMVSWADARDANPDALVLERPTGALARPYGTVPYPNYETAPPTNAYLTDEVDDRLKPKQRVVGINLGSSRVALDRSELESERVVTIDREDGEAPLVAIWEPGTVSALDGRAIEDGVAVGAVGVFLTKVNGVPLTFTTGNDDGTGDSADVVIDTQTGSTWNISGQATSGPLAGQRLQPVAHLDTFWFAWSRYHPDTALIG